MIRPKLAVCAESIVIDAGTNIPSILNLIEEMNLQIFPAAISKLSVLFILERDQEDPAQSDAFIIFVHAGNEIFRSPARVDFQDRLSLRYITVVGGFVLPVPGIFRAAMIMADQELAGWDIRVNQIGAPQPQVRQS